MNNTSKWSDNFQHDFEAKVKIRMMMVVLALCVVNFLTIKFFWYDIVWWFDMPMHFFGGFFIGLLAFYINSKKEGSGLYDEKKMLKFVLFFTLAIGFGWEVFEYAVASITHGTQIHMVDSISDIFFDTAGMLCALVYVFSHKIKEKVL